MSEMRPEALFRFAKGKQIGWGNILYLVAWAGAAWAGKWISRGSSLPWLVLLVAAFAVLTTTVPLHQLFILILFVSLAYPEGTLLPYYAKLPIPGVDVWFTIGEISFLVILLAWLLTMGQNRIGTFRLTGVNRVILLLFGTTALSAVIGLLNGNYLQDVIQESRVLLLYAVAFIVTAVVLQRWGTLRDICTALLAGAAIHAALFIVALAFKPDLVYAIESFERIYRLRLGVVRQSIFVIPLAVQIGFFSDVDGRIKWLARFALLVQSTTEVLSISRGHWIGSLLAVSLVVLLNLGRRSSSHHTTTLVRVVSFSMFLVILAAIIFASLPVLLGRDAPGFLETLQSRATEIFAPEGPASVHDRLWATRQGYDFFLTSPIVGHGLGTEVTQVVTYSNIPYLHALRVDNPWIWFLIKGGIVWALVWFALLLLSPIRAYGLLRGSTGGKLDEYIRVMLIFTIASSATVLIQVVLAMSNMLIENPTYIMILASSWGAMEGIAMIQRQEKRRLST